VSPPTTPPAADFTPAWARHAVWYQILPERFHNGDPRNDPVPASLEGGVFGGTLAANWQPHPWTSDWYRRQPWERDPTRPPGAYLLDRRYGGDLAGIIARLGYLHDLGINALYLNPVFDAPSHHKYDASGWHHVDPHLGPDPAGDRALMAAEQPDDPRTWRWTAADRQLLDLVDQAHRRGMRIVLDGVFNHVGRQHWAFRDVLAQGRRSRLAGWFKITRWHDDGRFDYEGWRGHGSLPELRQQDGTLAPEPLAHVEAVTRRWMAPDGDASRGIDGWRLDVASWLPHRFWHDWRELVKALRPDAYLVAEIINDVEFNEPYLRGDEFDAVMNYNFAFACDEFFLRDRSRITASEFDTRLRRLREAYPACVAPVMQNLFGSHDTARLATHAQNRDRFDYRDFDGTYHPQASRAGRADTRRPDAQARALQRLLVFFQMTALGAPMVYYGDEAGMWGANDPCCRKPMLWPDLQYEPEATHPDGTPRNDADPVAFDHDLHAYYRRAIALRHAVPALRTGSVETLLADDAKQVLVHLRRAGDELAIVAVNRSEQDQVIEMRSPGAAAAWHDRWNGRVAHVMGRDRLVLRLEGLSGALLLPGQTGNR
jgi:cyclomaltodextrinase